MFSAAEWIPTPRGQRAWHRSEPRSLSRARSLIRCLRLGAWKSPKSANSDLDSKYAFRLPLITSKSKSDELIFAIYLTLVSDNTVVSVWPVVMTLNVTATLIEFLSGFNFDLTFNTLALGS